MVGNLGKAGKSVFLGFNLKYLMLPTTLHYHGEQITKLD